MFKTLYYHFYCLFFLCVSTKLFASFIKLSIAVWLKCEGMLYHQFSVFTKALNPALAIVLRGTMSFPVNLKKMQEKPLDMVTAS